MTDWFHEPDPKDPHNHWKSWKLERDSKKIHVNNYLSALVLALAAVVVVMHQGVI
ncbi:hypothetical protein [Pseudoruegeria sp. HB172150]|uniref:hypothetical protein n=1 Tax=Pseudoruegeria sp. HB172150 TaxID=2721164 RepID=UPI0015575A19|nr:hypothetical protein [Pseudoruegeria sp. HB172150]